MRDKAHAILLPLGPSHPPSSSVVVPSTKQSSLLHLLAKAKTLPKLPIFVNSTLTLEITIRMFTSCAAVSSGKKARVRRTALDEAPEMLPVPIAHLIEDHMIRHLRMIEDHMIRHLRMIEDHMIRHLRMIEDHMIRHLRMIEGHMIKHLRMIEHLYTFIPLHCPPPRFH